MQFTILRTELATHNHLRFKLIRNSYELKIRAKDDHNRLINCILSMFLPKER